ncbi:hypothetical protein ABW19_dt0210284 [Dactylella cylindrospora]|nr:hypothetical protein ABW19_dt0210284 [Dactylella cylindrospora]
MIDLFYRRPDHVDSASSWPTDKRLGRGGFRVKSRGRRPSGVPDQLAFERMVQGETCSPCSLTDFMNYLRFAESSSDTLQFYMWYRDYTKRFHDLNVSEQSLSPPYRTKCPHEEAVTRNASPVRELLDTIDRPYSMISEDAAGQSFARDAIESEFTNPVFLSFVIAESPLAGTEQPFRGEITRVTSLYLLRGSPLELNLPVGVRDETLEAIKETTHPSALEAVVSFVEDYLRNYAHPNFIRHALSNANPARLSMITIFGLVNIGIAILIIVLVTTSTASRFTRLSSALFCLLGTFALINSKRGLCIVLVALGTLRNLDPWEVYAIEQIREGAGAGGRQTTAVVGDLEQGLDKDEEVRIRVFVKDYENRPVLSRIYEKRVHVEDKNIRRIQLILILQSLVLALMITCTFEAVVLVLPSGNLF